MSLQLEPVGTVESSLTDPARRPSRATRVRPRRGSCSSRASLEALDGIAVGDDMLVLTWLDRARRDVLRVHPRGDLGHRRAGRVQHPLAGPPESDRAAPRDGRRDRRRGACASATSRR